MNKSPIFISATMFLVLLLGASCGNKKGTTNAGHLRSAIEFEDTIHHFGTIYRENPIDSFDFKFKNTGNKLVVILGANTSCKCTTVKHGFEPIKPEETSYIRVIYDGTGRQPEYFSKSAIIYTSASDELIKLTIDGKLQ